MTRAAQQVPVLAQGPAGQPTVPATRVAQVRWVVPERERVPDQAARVARVLASNDQAMAGGWAIGRAQLWCGSSRLGRSMFPGVH